MKSESTALSSIFRIGWKCDIFVKAKEYKSLNFNKQFMRSTRGSIEYDLVRSEQLSRTSWIAFEQKLEVCTSCFATVYFEKLCLQNLVDKQNRKLVASCSLYKDGASSLTSHWFLEKPRKKFEFIGGP